MEKHSFSIEEKWWGDKTLQQINGFWCLPMMIPGYQRVLAEFKPGPNDVIVASFPKTGTTWLKTLLFSIINPSSLDTLVKNHPNDLVHFLEASDSSIISDNPSPDTTRIFCTHIPYQLLGETLESSGCRVIYITRNPKDTLNSLWHFTNKWKIVKEEPWELGEAVEKFCAGIVHSGPYYEHVLEYRTASLKNPGKVFFITYEELMVDTETHVKRLAEFLGRPFAEGDKRVEEIVKSCSFEVLSNHKVNKSDKCHSGLPIPGNSFFRQAKMGDYKNYLNNDTIERIDKLTREKFHEVGFIYGI